MQTKKKTFIWVILMIWLSLIGIVKHDMILSLVYGEYLDFYQLCLGLTGFSWQLLRLTSFSLDYCDSKSPAIKLMHNDGKISHKTNVIYSFGAFLGYSFYMPILMEGLPFNYSHYATMIQYNKWEKLSVRSKQLFVELIRLFFIYLLNELMLHYFYTDAVIYNEMVIAQFLLLFLVFRYFFVFYMQNLLFDSLLFCFFSGSILKHCVDGHYMVSLFV